MMASIDGSRSLQAASDDGCSFECSPCEYRSVAKLAMFYCPECQEYLCETCESAHKSLKLTRNHAVLSGNLQNSKEDTAKLKTAHTVLCSCNAKQVTIYCTKHNEVLCVDCKTLKHRTCQTSNLGEASGRFHKNEASVTLKHFSDIKEKLMALHNNRSKDLTKLTNMTSDCRKNVQSFKADLIAKLDLLEKRSLSEVEKYKREQRNVIEQHIETCNTALNKIESEIQQFEKAKTNGNRELLFVYNLQITKTTDNLCKLYSDVNKEMREPSITFEPEQRLNIADLLTLGAVKCNDTAIGQTRKAVAEMRIKSVTKVDCRIASDKSNPSISGSVFLSTGELVLCDPGNYKIKVFNMGFTLNNYINLPATCMPWDISLTGDTEVLVTITDKKMLQFVRILPKLQLGRSIKLDKETQGVAVNNGNIYISFTDGEIRVIDKNGTRKKTVGQNHDGTFRFLNPMYIAVSSAGLLYIPNSVYEDAAVHCLTEDGFVIYTYEDPELQLVEGMYVDGGGNVLACDYSLDNVHVIDKNGKKKKILLSKNDGIVSPRCIDFRPKDNCLVVGGANQHLFVIRLI